MLGLGSYISNSNVDSEGILLPYEGSYIYLENKFKIANANAGAHPVTVHSRNDISFDDSVLEAFSFEGAGAAVYTEISAGNKYTTNGTVLAANDIVTITGNILRYDNNEVWDGDDTSTDGFVEFQLNANDIFRVYIDLQNTSSIGTSNYDRVDSDGAFSVTKGLANNASRFNITGNYIANGGVMVPGVRISNLTMTKS